MLLLRRLLLLTCLLPTGGRCEDNSVFVYSRLGGSALLPCAHLFSTNCSDVSWTFYKDGRFSTEVSGGQVRPDTHKAGRLSVTSGCSLHLRGLRVEDAGSYACLVRANKIADVYLSLLTVTSPATVTDLQPGRNLTLSCVLFTYYDAGNCKSYSSMFNLSWTAGDGAALPGDSRYELIHRTRCNIALVINLQRGDNSRRWRCQVNTRERSGAEFLDFTSVFLLEAAQDPSPSVGPVERPVELPISRIVLCVALPVMVIVVGIFTRRGERRRARTCAAGIELQEVH